MAKLTASYKLNEEQLAAIKQLVPEVFKDNRLDFNSLYEALSDYTGDDDENDIEQYGLSWPGKRTAKRAAAIPHLGTLVPVPGDGIDEETTRNIYIEGDNLEILKIIRKAYAGRVKMIYIDPPYNTGNDFIYDDNFTESVESFQKRTGQIDGNGVKMTTNNRSDGRFHSKWCSMMYPRLRLARDFLTNDGVMFISIDDNEVAQLRKICDEIFGEENFVACLNWNTKKAAQGMTTQNMIVDNHEYVLVYAKESSMFKFLGIDRDENNGFSNPDNDPRGLWKRQYLQRLGQGLPKREVKDPETGHIYTFETPYTQEKINRWIEEKRILFPKNVSQYPARKEFLSEYENKQQLVTYLGLFATKATTEKLYSLFNNEKVFNNPKPETLITFLIRATTKKEDLVLDFFSGSATAAHGVMQINAEDGSNRKFILVQLQEEVTNDNKAAYDFLINEKKNLNICEIGKERIRRAGKKIKEDAGLNTGNLDTGFKVFRLAPSNYKAWENYKGTDVKQLEELFKEDSLKPVWKEENLLCEVMLLEGFPLDSNIETLPHFKKNKVKKISSDFHENTLFVCFDKEIHKETVETLNLSDKDRFICLDSAVDDKSKIRLEDKNLIKTL